LAYLKKAGKIAFAVFRLLGILILVSTSALWTGIKLLNKKLDVFRKTDTMRIITNCAVAAVIVSILITVMLLIKPSVDARRAQSLAEKGRTTDAVRIVEKLRKDGYKEKKLVKTQLSVADKLIDARAFDEASALLSEMNKSEETQLLSLKLTYKKAQTLYENRKYSEAAQMFYQIPQHRDSLEKYNDCRCALAIEAWLDGQENLVQGLLLDIPDVADRVGKVAKDVAKDEYQLSSILLSDAFNEEALLHFEQSVQLLNFARETMPRGKIAAGYRHTIGLAKDGKVYAVGDNSYGQATVSQWSNVVQIAAGAYHSVALFSDGTVDAVGDNSQNQLDVYGWTDIVAVAASAYDTIGLKADGTVVACGMHADLVSGWHGVTMITGGAHSMGCLYDKGYMMSTHAGAQMDMSVVLFDLSVSGGVSAGILYDGSLIANFENAPEWTDIVSIEATGTGLFAINTDGKLLSHFFRPGDAVEFTLPSEAVEIASGGTHHVVLTKDGRVYSFGDNEFGQLNTEDWSL